MKFEFGELIKFRDDWFGSEPRPLYLKKDLNQFSGTNSHDYIAIPREALLFVINDGEHDVTVAWNSYIGFVRKMRVEKI
jgi:hypothetical protein